ncbi:histidinol-phosphatase HisJ family protein [Pseudoflavonifractor sp. 524-17]|uniref:histidinol-phosphatase HisJ family protein n=1 Tax=Pseudoflavonifractor sp. 524-17 TaxID=2304577 RepID=UPI001379AE32|nr:histidinol-phosphatase HisJ family protein [Pseudoflavonifractor sp. 524-17]NCE64899.1 histidinol-phosphatase HisJ family protein [Pseudoflavonifractor sp. 524-17]
MYYIDYHTHSVLSPDSEAPLADMAQGAVQAGLAELCVTDHYDRLTEEGDFAPGYDWAPALAQYQAVQDSLGGKLNVKLGIEYGGAPFDPAYAKEITSLPELDFVIGSLHNLSPQQGGRDFFFLDYQDRQVCRRVLDDYFASMAELAELAETYDILGHVIYPLRYMPQDVAIDPYLERIDAILKRVAEAGRGMEVNTYCGRTIQPWRPVLERFRAHGGELVTVGSDAHAPQMVGRGIPEAYALLAELGFRYVAVYEKRRPGFIPIIP